MPLKDKPWFPYVSIAAWFVGVFALVLVNSGGNVVLAVALAAVVAVLSWRIDGARRGRDKPSADGS